MSPSRRRSAACLAAATALLGAAALPAAAPAQDSRFQVSIHAEYSGDRTSDFRVGELLDVLVKDTQGKATERTVCWTPAPIDRPACSSSSQGAPAEVGTQKVDITMSDGSKVTHSFAVGPAAGVVGKGTENKPPVPFQASCATALYGNYGAKGFETPMGTIAPGEQVAAYYVAGSGVYQVVSYKTFVAGFASASCLKPVSQASSEAKSSLYTLASNKTKTYYLKIPAGFKVAGKGPGTGVAYEIDVKGGGFGNGVANPINPDGGGVHQPFLGATVISDGFDNDSKRWFVRVKTGKLKTPLTLQLFAYGTRSGS